MASNRSKPSSISSSAPPPPPRTLNVQKFAESRAPELESLHEIVAGRLGHDFRIQRGKRRRTTGHLVAKIRRRKRRRVLDGHEPEDGVKKVSRRARRRAELQENPLIGFCVSGDGTKRLRTHLWHAKRFTMDSILSVLKNVLLPSPSDDFEKLYKPIANGVCYKNAMMDESGVSVSCSSLVGHLAKLDVIGSKANQTIKKLLCPVPEMIISQIPISLAEISVNTEDRLTSLWSEPEANGVFLSNSESLWDSSDKLNPPLQESILSAEKHLKRLEFFCLDQSNNPTSVIGSRDGSSRSCPVLLLKHKDIGNSSMGWSIILPLSWAKVFWVALVSHGAHAIGLRERQWIACNNGLPSFPFDFPDCEAYSTFMAAKCTEADRNAELHPPASRPLKVPIPPPWDCVMSTIERGQNIIEDHQTLAIHQADQGEVPSMNPISSLEQATLSVQVFIPRTSDTLKQYIEKKADRHLLLFPDQALLAKDYFSDPKAENSFSSLTRCSNPHYIDRKPCFVRVLLHAHKEGFFEEGAVICAPTHTDISNWTSSSSEEDKDTLQIPQCTMRSYFSQNVSGQWHLNLPVDNSTLQTFRWPIGFITSGFVPGSGKSQAMAYCEATLLSLLRNQQWSIMNKKSKTEILVLVRNLRSTAHRRALATIVLEHQKEDLDFM
ncbi:hypothetical protein J5N97_018339 [Dioscorea zingiberensis]|uniref:Uncharacterized protein n=1 Tax=Dioscorea zingiberensis TaxID=325984 RepID=A0A9D5CP23_9LILI|nr:hypothetical protein J5N97_018339 [Dioscorea zingiberensis]